MGTIKRSAKTVLLLLLALVILPTLAHAATPKGAVNKEQIQSAAEHFIFYTFSEEATGEVERDRIASGCDDFVKYCELRLEHNKSSQIPVDHREMDLEMKEIQVNDPYIDVKFRALEHIEYTGAGCVTILGYDYYIRFIEEDGSYKIVKASDGGIFEREIRAYVEADYPDHLQDFEEKSACGEVQAQTLASTNQTNSILDRMDYSYNDMIEASLEDMRIMKGREDAEPARTNQLEHDQAALTSASFNRTAMRNYMIEWAFGRNPVYLDGQTPVSANWLCMFLSNRKENLC